MFYQTLAPQQTDNCLTLINKSVQLVNLLNGGPVDDPTYFPEGSDVKRTDTKCRLLQKFAGSTQVYAQNT